MISTSGEIKRYCSEPLEHIENYEEAVNDKDHKWECHHKLEIQGPFRNSKALLIKCGMYWQVPASQLIFLRRDEHLRLHNKGKTTSEETRRKMSVAMKGKKNGLGYHHSEEERRKISEAKKGHHCSEDTRRKISEALKNRRVGK